MNFLNKPYDKHKKERKQRKTMKAHIFYLVLLIVVLAGFAIFLPQNTMTGYSVCEGCAELCSESTDCGAGLICCPTMWESGVCHKANSCAAVAEISMQSEYEEYKNPEPPLAIKNIAWKTFFLPLLAVLAIVVFALRRKQ